MNTVTITKEAYIPDPSINGRAADERVKVMTDEELLIAAGLPKNVAKGMVEYGLHHLEKDFGSQIEWKLANHIGKFVKKLKSDEKAKVGAIMELVRRGRNLHGAVIADPETAKHYLLDIQNEEREMLKVLYLDARRRLLAGRIISVGTVSMTLVHPREILKPALEMGAFSIIMAHNHPSGDSTPSQEDRTMNRRIWEACRTMGIELDDNLIVARGEEGVFSMRRSGMLG